MHELDITLILNYGLPPERSLTSAWFSEMPRETQTRPDIFIDVFQAGLNVSITHPFLYSMVVDPGSEISVSAAATMADSITLYINDRFLKSGETTDQVTAIIANPTGELGKGRAWINHPLQQIHFYLCKEACCYEVLP
jgi:hypothetical protein